MFDSLSPQEAHSQTATALTPAMIDLAGMKHGEMPTTPIPLQKRLVDLVAFSVSEDYFACRKQLGLQVV